VDTLKDSASAPPAEKTTPCAGHRSEYPPRELIEVRPDRHDNLVFFAGRCVCKPCARP